jgi:hypothetical protein
MTCEACRRSIRLYGLESANEFVFMKDKCSCVFLGCAPRRTVEVQFHLGTEPLVLYCKDGCCDLLNDPFVNCRHTHILEKRGWRHVKRY